MPFQRPAPAPPPIADHQRTVQQLPVPSGGLQDLATQNTKFRKQQTTYNLPSRIIIDDKNDWEDEITRRDSNNKKIADDAHPDSVAD